jgi:hypothetical protein
MRTLILAAGALAIAGAAHAQTAVTTQESGVRSAPVAGATPQAREYPSPGTTVLEQRERSTVVESRPTMVEERATVVEERHPYAPRYERNTQARERTPGVGDGTSSSRNANQN